MINIKKLKEGKLGITLLALIITIIVLLILAGIIISMVIGEDGILDRVDDAVDETEIARDDEEKKLKELSDLIDDYANITIVDKLKGKYELYFYNDLKMAIDSINDGKIKENGEEEQKENSLVAYIDENGSACLALIKDCNSDKTVELKENVNLNLAGKILSFDSNKFIKIENSKKLTIDGTKKDSKVVGETTLIKNFGNCIINGGVFEINSTNIGTKDNPNANIIVDGAGTIEIDNSFIVAKDTNKGTLAGIYFYSTTSTGNISNTNIEVDSPYGLNSTGIRNQGNVNISNCNINAYSNYTANATGSAYASDTRGIINNGSLVIQNSYVYGTHSGIVSIGDLAVSGGTYEGYGHGGFYLAGAGKIYNVSGANINQVDMKNGYYDDGVAGCNYAGFYIGLASNITINMDNCNVYGQYYPVVFRRSGGEKNNTLNLTNSNFAKGSKGIRIGYTSDNHKFNNNGGNNLNGNIYVYK